jgi:hypothetical protein
VVEEGVPPADRLAIKVPKVVIGPPAKLIYVELLVDIDVTVPILFAASIDATISDTGILLVTFSELTSVPIR